MTAQTLEILERAEFSPKQSRLIAEAIEVEVRAQHSDLRVWIDARLDARISEAKADIIKWMFLFIVGQTAVLFGGMFFILSHFKA